MTVQIPDRFFVQEVLAGKHRTLGSAQRGTPVILELENSEAPVLASSGMPCLAAASFIVLASTVHFALNFFTNIHPPFIFLPAVIVIAICVAGAMSVCREQKKRAWDEMLQDACRELSMLFEEQKDYLARLDERMVRYFNSNTINDSYTLFILMQIKDLSQHRLKRICDLLQNPNHERILLAHRLFVKPLSIRESVIEGLGRSHHLPISEIRETTLPLLEYLQENILALEAEAVEMQEEARRTTMDGWKAA